MGGVWCKELPSRNSQKTSQEAILKSESSTVEDSDKTLITRAELIEMLKNNGIAYAKNQKSETLMEKLPDDISRNFKLAESGTSVQTE